MKPEQVSPAGKEKVRIKLLGQDLFYFALLTTLVLVSQLRGDSYQHDKLVSGAAYKSKKEEGEN